MTDERKNHRFFITDFVYDQAKNTMLIPNGQKLTPKISPCWVLLKPNCVPQPAIRKERKTNPNADATSTVKQPQKSFFREASSDSVAMVVLLFFNVILPGFTIQNMKEKVKNK